MSVNRLPTLSIKRNPFLALGKTQFRHSDIDNFPIEMMNITSGENQFRITKKNRPSSKFGKKYCMQYKFLKSWWDLLTRDSESESSWRITESRRVAEGDPESFDPTSRCYDRTHNHGRRAPTFKFTVDYYESNIINPWLSIKNSSD